MQALRSILDGGCPNITNLRLMWELYRDEVVIKLPRLRPFRLSQHHQEKTSAQWVSEILSGNPTIAELFLPFDTLRYHPYDSDTIYRPQSLSTLEVYFDLDEGCFERWKKEWTVWKAFMKVSNITHFRFPCHRGLTYPNSQEVTDALPLLPNLRSVTITCGGQNMLPSLQAMASAVREVILPGWNMKGDMHKAVVWDLSRCRAEKLVVGIWDHNEGGYATLGTLAKLVRALPSLTRLEVKGWPITRERWALARSYGTSNNQRQPSTHCTTTSCSLWQLDGRGIFALRDTPLSGFDIGLEKEMRLTESFERYRWDRVQPRLVKTRRLRR
ncbi:hypothetical protein HDV00_004381 [Rhizophlyctis rosea]|nr:hypothetical protein HDV00_004381 [Rhizophlyctis rosea]